MVAYLLRLMKEIDAVLMAFGIEFFVCVCQFVCSHFSHVNKVAVLAILQNSWLTKWYIYLAFLDLYIQLVIASFFFYTSDFLSNKGPVLSKYTSLVTFFYLYRKFNLLAWAPYAAAKIKPVTRELDALQKLSSSAESKHLWSLALLRCKPISLFVQRESKLIVVFGETRRCLYLLKFCRFVSFSFYSALSVRYLYINGEPLVNNIWFCSTICIA